LKSISDIHKRPVLSRNVRLLLAVAFLIVAACAASAQSPAQNPPQSQPDPTQTAPTSPTAPATTPATTPAAPGTAQATAPPTTTALPLDEAVKLALTQASNFQQAQIAERIAAEDVKQARAAFLPRVSATASPIYNSPSPGHPGEFSFISANAIREYEALAGVNGDIDLSGRLRATLRRNAALLEAAHAGTEVARRALVVAVDEAYFGLALATAKRRAAEQTLAATAEFERITQLSLNAGEVAQVDLLRAQLQTSTRRDELEQARAAESVAADSLRLLIGYDFAAPVLTTDLSMTPPDIIELDRFTTAMIPNRPEFLQFDAQRRAAEQEAKAARAERLPQISYTVNGGFDTDSLRPDPLKSHTGVLASITLTIPLFDWGASRSRERQARLRAQTVTNERTLAERTFAQQFSTARTQAISAASRIRLLQDSVATAERILETSIARYRAGEAPILEVTDAQTSLATQRAALFQALFDYQIARARLAQATGQ
jgi:outer membrane protein TolC